MLNISRALRGEYVRTSDGDKARIVHYTHCFEEDGNLTIYSGYVITDNGIVISTWEDRGTSMQLGGMDLVGMWRDV